MLTTSPIQKSAKVLIVDDDHTMRLLTRATLEKNGFRVEEAEDGSLALEVFRDFHPDLVLLDVMMPRMDGYATCTALRTLLEGEYLPIVIVTGLDDIDSINRAYEAGATDFITKPINWALLAHRVRYILRASNAFHQRKQLEEQLYQSQKMEAVGRLAGGVAHDFNNILTVIRGCSEFIISSLKEDDSLHQDAASVIQASEQAACLTRQLLAFSRKQVLQPKVFDLNNIVSIMDKMFRRIIGEHIELNTMLGSESLPVKADPGQLEQVIMNLVINARDAMPQGGRLTLESTRVFLDEAYCRLHVDVTPGSYVLLAISDTGMGMDTETQTRIFEPFFTTKDKERGTGLGLATVHGIIRQSEGFIWVYSEPGQGTTFKIYLPEAQEKLPEQGQASAPTASWQGQETVLVVEDEELVRRVARRILQNYGYIILEASTGREALVIGEEYPGPIHLLLTDVMMPEMGGKELVDRWKDQHPETQVIFTSGYTENAIVHNGNLDPDIHFIQKPYRPNALARMVREVLDDYGNSSPKNYWGEL
jgi:two-component system cell cycle sensor histidine kinase/response regulator CckA